MKRLSGNIQILDQSARDILAALARRFPVCTSSDEFHFFPQVPIHDAHWSRWDDFSPESMAAFLSSYRQWRRELDRLETELPSADAQIDLRLLRRMLATLHEQLTLLAVHEKQPTFHLTIMGIGLADAIDAGPGPLEQRLRHLPVFLRQARASLQEVPSLFNRLGLEMAGAFRSWLTALPVEGPFVSPVLTAIDRFIAHLKAVPVAATFLPPVEVYARIAAEHIGCRVSMAELENALDCEIRETTDLLRRHAARVAPGQAWQDVVTGLKRPDASVRPEHRYRDVIEALAQHCVERQMIAPDLPRNCPVRVASVPEYMAPVRSSAAFSAVPGHPSRGGTFFIAADAEADRVPADYRLLTAHETYPGHHVLDVSRWNLGHPLRRHLEFPLFYEGWASFSEELMFDTGFFGSPVDKLLMAKRRFWRALRGRVDFDIHMRRRNLSAAAALLTLHGMSQRRAAAMVARYTLKPGYQLAYAFGRRRFRRLYDQYPYQGVHKPAAFARLVLSQGEIEFDQLEMLLNQGGET